MSAEIAGACPGTVNAASSAWGSSGGRGAMGPMRSATASAISRVCRDAQMPEQLMQPRPLLMATLSTIRSRYRSQSSTTSSPRRILLNPGPCTCTPGLAAYCSTVAVPPKMRLRGELFSTAAPTSPRPG